jgi:regulatory protein
MVSRKANSSLGGSGWSVGEAEQHAAENRAGEGRGRRKRARPPLDAARLHDLALAYVARFATTGARLESYLVRKVRERGAAETADGEASPIDIPALVSRMIELGYVDDDAYARMRSRDLSERGFGARRIEQALWVAGVGEGLRADHAPDEAGCRRAAVQFGRKRRFGPFAARSGSPGEDCAERHKAREKAIAAMLRAGHDFAHARFVCDAADMAELEQWVAEAEDAGRDNAEADSTW